MTTLRDRFRFFHEHGGYRVGHRAEDALRLARAEERAEELGLTIQWENEWEAWDGDCPTPKILVAAYVPRLDGEKGSHAALGMIGLESWHDPYVRVVSAELFAEALDEIDAENERRWSRAADELTNRATFAGARR